MRIYNVKEEHIPEMWDYFQGFDYVLCFEYHELTDEMIEWIHDNFHEEKIPSSKARFQGDSYWFKHKADAVATILRWR